MNKIYLGTKAVSLPKGGCLFITKEFLDIPEWRHPRRFDPLSDSFNPLAGLDYPKACAIVDVFDALFTGGPATLTKEAGLEFIADILFDHEHPERTPKDFADLLEKIGEPDKKSPGHVWAYNKVRRILRSPVLSKVFTRTVTFSLKKGSVNQARINRAELVGFDARALAWFLMAQFSWQVVVQNYQPYAHDMHASLIEEDRFVVGVPMLSKLKGLREYVSIMEREYERCTYDDAVELAKYDCKHPPHTDGYDTFIKGAMAAQNASSLPSHQ